MDKNKIQLKDKIGLKAPYGVWGELPIAYLGTTLTCKAGVGSLLLRATLRSVCTAMRRFAPVSDADSRHHSVQPVPYVRAGAKSKTLKKISHAILISLFLFLFTYAETSILGTAESLLVRQEYDSARSVVDAVLKQAPEDNYALYLKIAIEQTEILDYESYLVRNAAFIALADSVMTVLENRLPALRGKDSVACLFYVGNIHGGISVLQAKVGAWFPALNSALTSVNMLKEVARVDSSLNAALLGIGVFNYYLSKSFKWLPLINADSEKEGVRMIEKAAAAAFPYNYAAKNSLCWILIERKKYGRADSIARTVLCTNPNNTIFLRIRTLIALWSGNDSAAVKLGERLGNIALVRKPVNWSDLVAAHYVVAAGYDALGRGTEALAAADEVAGKKIPAQFKQIPHIKKNLRKIQAIRKKYRPGPKKR